MTLQKNKSQSLFGKAQQYIPGGVNSPVRAFKAVGGDPLFIQSAKGAVLTDEDGNEFIELINSWGPMILGHAHEGIEAAILEAVKGSVSFGAPTAREVEIAELICDMVPSIEKVRMVNSGTEAAMSVARLARGYTGRDKIVKMEGHYHGHADSFLIAAGSGLATNGVPNSPGVTEGTAKDTLLVPYNNLEAVEQIVAANPQQIAAILLEPVPGNMGCVLPQPGYLEGLREICDREGIVLVFDEVMTGFRLAPGGAQEVFGVTPDITALGKIIGGGMPVGAYGGKKELMDFVSPQGPVYQAGTLSGNPVAMAAGLAMLKHLRSHPEVYEYLQSITYRMVSGIKQILEELNLGYTMNHIGSMYSLFFTDKQVVDFATAQTTDTEKFGQYFRGMLEAGVYLAPSQYESLFVSAALTEAQADHVIEANRQVLTALHS
ncbi:MAG: glutamate-1-semialdehyde 2,1-aminomutase [Bacteroidota bacterium]